MPWYLNKSEHYRASPASLKMGTEAPRFEFNWTIPDGSVDGEVFGACIDLVFSRESGLPRPNTQGASGTDIPSAWRMSPSEWMSSNRSNRLAFMQGVS